MTIHEYSKHQLIISFLIFFFYLSFFFLFSYVFCLCFSEVFFISSARETDNQSIIYSVEIRERAREREREREKIYKKKKTADFFYLFALLSKDSNLKNQLFLLQNKQTNKQTNFPFFQITCLNYSKIQLSLSTIANK